MQIVDYISDGKYGLFEVDDDGDHHCLQTAGDIESLLYFGSFAPDPTVYVSETCMFLLEKQPIPEENKLMTEMINKMLELDVEIEYNDEHEGDEWFGPEDEDDW